MKNASGALAALVLLHAFGSGCDGQVHVHQRDPGRVTVHRLNNTEYNNTVRDLLGTSRRPADLFPTDDYGEGFDNIADVLSTSPIQAEMYQRAAEDLAHEALALPWGESRQKDDDVSLKSTGSTASFAVDLAGAGTYRVAVQAWGQQAGSEIARMDIKVDGTTLTTVDVAAAASAPDTYRATVDLQPGAHTLSAVFLNDYYNPDAGADRNIFVTAMAIDGPRGQGSNPARDRILVCQPDPAAPEECARRILSAFARRAWRRPVSDGELARLLAHIDVARAQGEDVERGLELAVAAALSSPNFLFRFEFDPDPESLEPHPLGDYELASRLSYFIWSSMPDDELLEAADAGTLHERDVLAAQVDRMLADGKADALVENFAGQWMNLRALADHEVDATAFPDFTDALRDDMVTETKLLFRDFISGERPVSELLTAEYTYLNDRLAEHYGLEPPAGGDFARVSLAGGERRGLLGQGSILTVTSVQTRTSPVKRGKWVLEQLLCSAPPPPPPGVPPLDGETDVTGSIRDRMEAHRANPVCAACHQAMDPIGFALEHFDGVGAWRDKDGEYDIDATGTLPDGTSFDGAVELAQVLANDPRFPRCLTRKLMTYALGRGMEAGDQPLVDAVAREFVRGGLRLPDLVRAIALSDAFLYRRGEPAGSER
jgi:hypothetical protein